MTRRMQLRVVCGAREDDSNMPDKDPIEQALAGLEDDGLTDLSVDDLDRIYSEAVSNGVVNDDAEAFQRFLQHDVDRNPQGEWRLADQDLGTVGSCLREYRARRRLSAESVAAELGVSVVVLAEIERRVEVFDAAALAAIASTLSAAFEIPTVRIQRLLSAVDATLGLSSAGGFELRAARNKPPGEGPLET